MSIWIQNGDVENLAVRPHHVELDIDDKPYRAETKGFSRDQWNALGFNEKMPPLERKPFTTYETKWVKGDDFIYREAIVSAVEDEAAKAEHDIATLRKQRDGLLAETDWTQLTDSILDDGTMVLWQGYQQALRDLPQQPGFPLAVEWPEIPDTK